MTREEHLKFCKICKNKEFNPKKGIVCGLTGEIADFEKECPSFEKDGVAAEAVASKEALKDNSKRASVAIIVFWGIAIANVLAVVSGYFEYELLERIRIGGDFTDEEINSNDLRQWLIALGQMALYIASIITFLNWFRRAYANLGRINVGIEYKESWAVWSFFIPILNLFRPYQIAREIAYETRKMVSESDPNTFSRQKFPIVSAWWALFLITNWVGQFALKSVFKDDTIEQIITSTQAYMVSDFMDIPAAIITLVMIKRISKDEAKLFEINLKR